MRSTLVREALQADAEAHRQAIAAAYEAGLAEHKRRMYLVALAIGSMSGWLALLALPQSSSVESLFGGLMMTLFTGLFGLVAWRADALPLVERLVPAVFVLLLGGGLALVLFGSRGTPFMSYVDFVALAPALYIWLFLSFGTRNGLRASIGFYAFVAALLGLHGLFGPTALQEAERIVLNRFFVASWAYIAVLYAFASLIERQIEGRTRAEAVAQYAYTDALTGLPNRLLLHDRLTQAHARARRTGERLAVFFVDLDRFKLVNDTLGHAAGDVFLREIASRLRAAVRDSDTLARVSGDEFVLVAPSLSSAADALQIAERLQAVTERPISIHGETLYASTSIGVALYPDHASTPDDLLRAADRAMYDVKESGRNGYLLYRGTAEREPYDARDLARELRPALERGDFQLHYQPIYRLASGELSGFEALLRWPHPEHGLVPASAFVPVAEENGLIAGLGGWALFEACAQAKRWQDAGLPAVAVSVNVSAVQFARRDFVRTVARALAESGLEARWLELEVTERMVLQEGASMRLKALRALGVRISLDDFGTGYSSLAQLQRLPLDGFKIDRQFIAELQDENGSSESALVLVRTILSLAEALGLDVVAEGVETNAQLQVLRANGCDFAQGYLFGPAFRPADAAALLARSVIAERVA